MGLKIKNSPRGNATPGSTNPTAFLPPHPQPQNFGPPNQRSHVYYQFFAPQPPSTSSGPPPPYYAAAEPGNSFQHSALPCFSESGANISFEFANQQENNLPEIKEDDLQAILDSPAFSFEQEALLRSPFEFTPNIHRLPQNIPNASNRRFGSNYPIRQASYGFQEPPNYQNVAFALPPIIPPNLVTQFPQKQRIEGYDFKVSFPSDCTEFVVNGENDSRRIHTKCNTTVTIFFNYTAGEGARVRLLVVFTKEGQSANAVHPCLNHRNQQHPDHILLVSGVQDEYWERSPHPSILINPSVTNAFIDVNSTECFSYCAKMWFPCKNSCLTRKSLTLICQLENDGKVLARESFLLKVSASPRRDSKGGCSKRKLRTDDSQLDLMAKRNKTFFKQEGNCD